MNTYVVQLGCIGNFGMGSVFEANAENEIEAFNIAADADGGAMSIDVADLGEYHEDDLIRTDFSDAAYLSTDVSVTLVSGGHGGGEGLLRRGKNAGDGPEWEPAD